MEDLLIEKCKMLKQLCSYEKRGITLWLDGIRSTPLQVVEACIMKEGNDYMPDYVQDDNGTLYQLRFDRVTYY